jgi:hypothetical protein
MTSRKCFITENVSWQWWRSAYRHWEVEQVHRKASVDTVFVLWYSSNAKWSLRNFGILFKKDLNSEISHIWKVYRFLLGFLLFLLFFFFLFIVMLLLYLAHLFTLRSLPTWVLCVSSSCNKTKHWITKTWF